MVHVVIFERMVANALPSYQDVCRFLQIADDVSPDNLGSPINQYVASRSRRYAGSPRTSPCSRPFDRSPEYTYRRFLPFDRELIRTDVDRLLQTTQRRSRTVDRGLRPGVGCLMPIRSRRATGSSTTKRGQDSGDHAIPLLGSERGPAGQTETGLKEHP